MKGILQDKLVRFTICLMVGGAIASPTINDYWNSNVHKSFIGLTFIIGMCIIAFGVVQLFKPKSK